MNRLSLMPGDKNDPPSKNKDLFKKINENHSFDEFEQRESLEELKLGIYRVNKKINYEEIFSSISRDFDKLVLSQDEIKRFCEDNPNLFRLNFCLTLFLTKIKEENKFFVIMLVTENGKTRAEIFNLAKTNNWFDNDNLRIIAPLLA